MLSPTKNTAVTAAVYIWNIFINRTIKVGFIFRNILCDKINHKIQFNFDRSFYMFQEAFFTHKYDGDKKKWEKHNLLK